MYPEITGQGANQTDAGDGGAAGTGGGDGGALSGDEGGRVAASMAGGYAGDAMDGI